MTHADLMGLARQHFPTLSMAQNGSIVKQLTRKLGAEETGRLMAGARLLGWTDLRWLNSQDGKGRRMAIARFWQEQNAGGASDYARIL